MKVEILPCGESVSAFLWERGLEGVPAAENARLRVFFHTRSRALCLEK